MQGRSLTLLWRETKVTADRILFIATVTGDYGRRQ
jgi:hypothetical protein